MLSALCINGLAKCLTLFVVTPHQLGIVGTLEEEKQSVSQQDLGSLVTLYQLYRLV
jgi:hypothetical protein